jgi:hypothetical protein
MSNITSAQTYIQTQDVNFRSGVSANVLKQMGGTNNFLCDRLTPANTTLLCGSSGTFTTTSGSATLVTNQSGSLTVIAGRLIIATIVSDGSGNPINVNHNLGTTELFLYVGSTNTAALYINFGPGNGIMTAVISGLSAGSQTFSLKCAAAGSTAAYAQFLSLLVRQI